MTVVSSQFLEGVLTNFQALFAREFQAASALQGWRELAMPISSDGEQNTYEWFGTVPLMGDVTHGSPVISGLNEYNFSVVNSDFQAVIEVQRKALERDRLNLITPRIQQLGQEAAMHPGRLIFNLFETPGNAFDGAAFFANTRVIGASANVDNILVGTGTTVAQVQTDLAAARAQMRLYQDDQGRPMNLIGNTIVVHPDIEQIMWQALNVQQAGLQNNSAIPASISGVFSGQSYRIVVNPQLTDANDWYLLHIGGPAFRPFVLQTEKMPVLESDTNPDTRENILNRDFIYSVYGRYAVAVTDPRLAIRTTNS